MIPSSINGADTAWLLVCAALVLFMVPGLAMFYAGLVRRTNTLAMLQQNLVPLGIISITWVLVGYSLAYSNDLFGGFVGDLGLFGLRHLDVAPAPAKHVVVPDIAIPTLAFVTYEMMFAVITPALITGATASRLKPIGWVVVLALWSIFVYPIVAHWLFNPHGWMAQWGVQDWAGGLVVHASAGAAALALLVVVGRRAGWPQTTSVAHSIPLAVLGGGILWFGWFGFNAGDGLQANGVAAQAFLNTTIAAAGGMVAWLFVVRRSGGRVTVVASITGAVAGLATVTPAAGYVNTLSALCIGLIAGAVCHAALRLKSVFRFDDALDVIAVHFVGGVLGTLLLGLFGSHAVNAIGSDGLFFGGGASLLGKQAVGVVVVVAFSFAVTWVIAVVTQATVGLRLQPDEQEDMDRIEQGTDAYHLDGYDEHVVPAAMEAGDHTAAPPRA